MFLHLDNQFIPHETSSISKSGIITSEDWLSFYLLSILGL